VRKTAGLRGLVLPLVGAGVLAILPYAGASPFTITLLTESLIFAIWAMSLDLLVGYTGLVSFGHAAAFGLAAYAAGYFAREVTGDFFFALLVAEAVVIPVALGFGFVVARVSGIAFAVISLCIAQVLFTIAVTWRSVTNGMDGLVGVPLPKVAGITLGSGNAFYLLTVLCLVAVYLCSPAGGFAVRPRSGDPDQRGARRVDPDRRPSSKRLAFVCRGRSPRSPADGVPQDRHDMSSLHWTESGNVLIMTDLRRHRHPPPDR
jgi:branched-chain amino acid transport system permease protein